MCYAAECNNEQSDMHADVWDLYLLKLNHFRLAALGERTMFEHVFHIIHLLVKSSSSHHQLQSARLCDVFVDDPALNVRRSHSRFMSKLFIPVASAMDKIFNWRKEINILGATDAVE